LKTEIVCICGSLRFRKEIGEAELHFVKQKCIVLTPCCMYVDAQRTDSFMEYKELFDEIHKRKIDICDFVFVVNRMGYVGESTKSEIDYAESIGKPIYFLETENGKAVKNEKS